jgi:antitoxin MazE
MSPSSNELSVAPVCWVRSRWAQSQREGRVRQRARVVGGVLLDLPRWVGGVRPGGHDHRVGGGRGELEHAESWSKCSRVEYEIRMDIHLQYVYPINFWETRMQVSRWGNSLAVRLPAAVVEALGLKEGDDIEIHVEGSRVFSVKKSPTRRELLARLRKYRGRLPDGFVFDRLEAHERD